MMLVILLALLSTTTAAASVSGPAPRQPSALAEPAFHDRIPSSSKSGFRVEIVGSVSESWILRDPQGNYAAIRGLASENRIPGCTVVVDPDVFSGDCGGIRGTGSSFDVSRPLLGDWLLTLTCSDPKCKCGNTRVGFAARRSDRPPGWDVLRLSGPDSLTWSVHVMRSSVQVERTTIARPPSATLVVTVVDSTSGAFTPVPYANVEVNGRTFVSSEEGVLRASVDATGPCVVRVRALGWEIQPSDTITLVGGQIRELKHVMQGGPPVVKY